MDGQHPVPVVTESIFRQLMRAVGRTLLSLLLAGGAVLGSIVVFRQGLLPLIGSSFQLSPDWLSIYRRLGIPLVAVGAYWAYVRWHEKRSASELQLKVIHLLPGAVGGALLVALPMVALFGVRAYELVSFRGPSGALLDAAAVICIAATLEELAYRSVLFRLLERDWGTKVALLIQAVLFGLRHLANVEQAGTIDVVRMLVSVTLLGLLWAAVFILARNLWVVAAHHAAWNFTILLSGLPLSGIEDWRGLSPLESRYASADWLTGGAFGPESSLLVIVSTTIAVVLMLRAAQRRGLVFAPTHEGKTLPVNS